MRIAYGDFFIKYATAHAHANAMTINIAYDKYSDSVTHNMEWKQMRDESTFDCDICDICDMNDMIQCKSNN